MSKVDTQKQLKDLALSTTGVVIGASLPTKAITKDYLVDIAETRIDVKFNKPGILGNEALIRPDYTLSKKELAVDLPTDVDICMTGDGDGGIGSGEGTVIIDAYVSGGSGNYTYSWNTIFGSEILWGQGTGRAEFRFFNGEGLYTVGLTVTDGEGGFVTKNIRIFMSKTVGCNENPPITPPPPPEIKQLNIRILNPNDHNRDVSGEKLFLLRSDYPSGIPLYLSVEGGDSPYRINFQYIKDGSIKSRVNHRDLMINETTDGLCNVSATVTDAHGFIKSVNCQVQLGQPPVPPIPIKIVTRDPSSNNAVITSKTVTGTGAIITVKMNALVTGGTSPYKIYWERIGDFPRIYEGVNVTLDLDIGDRRGSNNQGKYEYVVFAVDTNGYIASTQLTITYNKVGDPGQAENRENSADFYTGPVPCSYNYSECNNEGYNSYCEYKIALQKQGHVTAKNFGNTIGSFYFTPSIDMVREMEQIIVYNANGLVKTIRESDLTLDPVVGVTYAPVKIDKTTAYPAVYYIAVIPKPEQDLNEYMSGSMNGLTSRNYRMPITCINNQNGAPVGVNKKIWQNPKVIKPSLSGTAISLFGVDVRTVSSNWGGGSSFAYRQFSVPLYGAGGYEKLMYYVTLTNVSHPESFSLSSNLRKEDFEYDIKTFVGYSRDAIRLYGTKDMPNLASCRVILEVVDSDMNRATDYLDIIYIKR